MADLDPKLKEQLREFLQEEFGVDDIYELRQSIDFVNAERKARRDLWKNTKSTVIRTAITTMVGGILVYLYTIWQSLPIGG